MKNVLRDLADRVGWQNLNRRPRGADGRRAHGPPTHGRAWLRLGAHTLGVEWVLGGHRCLGAGVSVGGHGDDRLTAHLDVAPCALYVGVAGPRASALIDRLCPDGKPRDVAARIDLATECVDGPNVHWRVWSPSGEWSRATPRWRDGGFFLWPALFGEFAIADRVLRDEVVPVAFPEKTYRARVRLVERTYTRPRWPGVWDRYTDATVAVRGGVPVPGKGEHAYDCGDDATHELRTGARSVSEAVGKFVANVLRTRERRGGLGWVPTSGRPRRGPPRRRAPRRSAK